MHPLLHEHLHTDECVTMIRALKRCRNENPWAKWIGYCNPLYDAMRECLHQESLIRQQNNTRKKGKKVDDTAVKKLMQRYLNEGKEKK